MIFVFGSNMRGIHGAGTAKIALRRYGAVLGIGEGPMGDCYAIPTKITPYKVRKLMDIRASVDNFLNYAEAHQEKRFVVTAIGTGLAGFKHEVMAPMFQAAAENCEFDPIWEKWGLTPWKKPPF